MLRKSEKKLLSVSKFVRKYIVLDYRDKSLTIFPKRPPSDDDLDTESIPADEIIDFQLIEQVLWLSEKKNGRRFNVEYISRGETRELISVHFVASTTSKAKQWVKLIAEAVSGLRAHASRGSRADERKSSKRLSLGRKSLDNASALECPTSCLTLASAAASLAPRKYSARSDFRESSVTELTSLEQAHAIDSGKNFAVVGRKASRIGVFELRRKSRSTQTEEIKIEAVRLNSSDKESARITLDVDTFTSPSTSGIEIQRDSSTIKKAQVRRSFTKPVSYSSDGDMKDSKPRRKSKLLHKQILITPFKESIWDLIQLYLKVFSPSSYEFVSLQDYTIKMLEKMSSDKAASESTVILDSIALGNIVSEADLGYESDQLEKDENGEVGMHLSDSEAENKSLVDIMQEIEVFSVSDFLENDTIRPAIADSAADQEAFKRLVHAKDLQQIQNELKSNAPKLSFKYDFESYDTILQGKDVLEFLGSKTKQFAAMSADDALHLAQELVKQEFLLPFPPQLQKTDRKKRLFYPDRLYMLPPTADQKSLLKILRTPDVQNYDFWITTFTKQVPASKKSKGFRSFEDTYKGKQISEFVKENIFPSDSDTLLFLNMLISEKAIVCVTDDRKDEFSPDGIYRVGEGDDNDSETDPELKETMCDAKATTPFKVDDWIGFVADVLDPAFIHYFCRLADDSAVLMSLLTAMEKVSSEKFFSVALQSKEKSPSVSLSQELIPSPDLRLPEQPGLLKNKMILYKLLIERSSMTLQKLQKVFDVESSEAHALAIDLYWQILKKSHLTSHICKTPLSCSLCAAADAQFNQFCLNHLSGSRCTSIRVKETLLGIMVDEVWSLDKPLVLNQHVLRPGIWQAYFFHMNGAGPNVLEDCLRDGFSLIINNSSNALDILAQNGWEAWILPFSVLENQIFSESVHIARTFSAQLYLHALFHSDSFHSKLLNTFSFLESKASTSGAYSFLAFDIFTILVQKLSLSSTMFPVSLDLESRFAFPNLLRCIRMICDFVFLCPDWATVPGKSHLQFLNTAEIDFEIHFGVISVPNTQNQYMFEKASKLCSRVCEVYKALHLMELSSGTTLGPMERQFMSTILSYFSMFKAGHALFETLAKEQLEGYRFKDEVIRSWCKKIVKGSELKRMSFVEDLQAEGDFSSAILMNVTES